MNKGGFMRYGTTGKVIASRKSDCRTKNTLIWIALALVIVVVVGCVSKPSNLTKNETVATSVATGTPIATNVTPSAGQPEFHAPAPYQLYIKAGQIYQFTYYNRNFTVNYISAYPTQIVKITFDGYEKTIRKEIFDRPNLTSWGEGGFGFTLRPVLWEIREDNRTIFQRQRVPLYERTWNTTELYFEVLGRG